MGAIGPQVQRLVLDALAPLIELLAPHRCGICEREGALLCEPCRERWIPTRLEAVPADELDAAAALGPYEGGLGMAIRTAKYGGVPALARELGIVAPGDVKRAPPPSISKIRCCRKNAAI